MVSQACEAPPGGWLSAVLQELGISRSTWYRRRAAAPKTSGRKRKPVPEALARAIREFAEFYPWWGYKRIAMVARRAGVGGTRPKWPGWAKAAKAKPEQVVDRAHSPVTTQTTVQPVTETPVSASASRV